MSLLLTLQIFTTITLIAVGCGILLFGIRLPGEESFLLSLLLTGLLLIIGFAVISMHRRAI